MNTQKECIYKNQQKVYINNDITRNEEYIFDELGGTTVINQVNGSIYYRMGDEVFQSKEHYIQEIRDRKLKELGL